ncbi:MAG: hypothetical protein M0D54_10790 [Hyphomonadaceae bacterium JAD_PAG50586_4]|nr:MAG: hypothetical protein M0D54_10790 [Hyphomonadaceae bacterium JAD_PAG50586_4]
MTSDSWALTPDGEIEVGRLAEELLRRFKEFEAEPLTQLRAGSRLKGDDALLVDRREQSEGALLALSDQQIGARRHALMLAYGLEDEEPRSFGRVTLPRRVLARADVAKQGSASARPLEIDWPTAVAKNARDFAVLMTSALAKELQGAKRGRGELSTLTLAETLNKEGIARIALAQLPPAAKSFGEYLNAIKHWCAFWDEFPFDEAMVDGQATFIPVLEIAFVREAERVRELTMKIRAAKDGTIRRGLRAKISEVRRRAGFERRLRKWLAKQENARRLTRAQTKVRLVVLPELGSIRADHVEHWLDNDADVFGEWDLTARMTLKENLKQAFVDAEELPMRDWAERARPLLKQN